MREGGSYIVDRPGAAARRVEFTRTAEEAAAERRAAEAAAKETSQPALKGSSKTSESGSKGK